MTVTVSVSPAPSVAVPVITGVVSFEVSGATVAAVGGVVSMRSSLVLVSAVALPAASVVVATTW